MNNKFIVLLSSLPFPGGPNSKIPRGGPRNPVKISGRSNGKTTASLMVVFTCAKPAMLFQSILPKSAY